MRWRQLSHWHARRFAHMQDLDVGTTSLVFELGQGMRLQSREAMWLAISRLIEERVAQLQGVADLRHWLLLIGQASQPPP